MKPLKILLSAYACEPHQGSEPDMGWHWAWLLAQRGHAVWVLTRKNNQPAIEAELARQLPQPNMQFLYADLPRWLSWWKRGGRGIQLYYALWQIWAFGVAYRAHRHHGFDVVQHVTFVDVRTMSWMGWLGIPFVLGPVGGGRRIPSQLRQHVGLVFWLQEWVRDLANGWVRFASPVHHIMFSQAQAIWVCSADTQEVIPPRFWSKTRIHLGTGLNEAFLAQLQSRHVTTSGSSKQTGCRFLYVGRFVTWKGMRLGLQAFARVVAQTPTATLTLVGNGPQEDDFRQWIDTLNLTSHVTMLPWQSRETLLDLYAAHDVFLFPSLRDNIGLVVLEAMACGLPVVCLDVGGPADMVNETCGRLVSARHESVSQVVCGLADAMQVLARDPELRAHLSHGARRRVQAFDWAGLIQAVYAEWETDRS